MATDEKGMQCHKVDLSVLFGKRATTRRVAACRGTPSSVKGGPMNRVMQA